MVCRNCETEIIRGKFCPKCGTEIFETPQSVSADNACVLCKAPLPPGAKFCSTCNARQETKKQSPLKMIVIAVILLLVGSGVAAWFFFTGDAGEKDNSDIIAKNPDFVDSDVNAPMSDVHPPDDLEELPVRAPESASKPTVKQSAITDKGIVATKPSDSAVTERIAETKTINRIDETAIAVSAVNQPGRSESNVPQIQVDDRFEAELQEKFKSGGRGALLSFSNQLMSQGTRVIDSNPAAAVEDLRKSIRANPDNQRAHAWLVYALITQDRIAEANVAIDQAATYGFSLNDLSSVNTRLPGLLRNWR